jgi:hypothetical protein
MRTNHISRIPAILYKFELYLHSRLVEGRVLEDDSATGKTVAERNTSLPGQGDLQPESLHPRFSKRTECGVKLTSLLSSESKSFSKTASSPRCCRDERDVGLETIVA